LTKDSAAARETRTFNPDQGAPQRCAVFAARRHFFPYVPLRTGHCALRLRRRCTATSGYNQQLPQSALASKAPLQAMKDRHKT
jgi:hypothetical protein